MHSLQVKARTGLGSGLLLLGMLSSLGQDAVFTASPATQPSPIITMDQADYEPGSTASFVGRGFAPLEAVTLQVLHADGTADSGEDHLPWTVSADENGQIISSWHVCEDDCANSVLDLRAVGKTSGLKAEVLFSDGFISNGGFEAATLLGWSVVIDPRDTVGSKWYVYSGTESPQSHKLISAPPEGTQAVVTDQMGQGYQMLYQDLVLEGGYTHTLSFKVYYKNWADAFYIGPDLTSVGVPNQQYRVDIIKTVAKIDSLAAGDVLATLFTTRPGDPLQLPPTLITTDLTAFAGSTVRLRFAVVEAVGFFNGSVDDVKLVSTPRQCLSMNCQSDLLVNADAGQCSAVVNFALPAAVSSCAGINVTGVTAVPTSGSSFPVGTTPVKCTATDSAGNSVSCTFNVIVKDSQAPVITLAPAADLKPNPNGLEIANAFGFPTVTDNCGIGLVPSGTIQAEQGTGCTRSATKNWVVTDAAGNTATASQTVTFIRDTERPVIKLTPGAPVGYNPSDAEIAAAFGSAAVSDNCSSGLVATGVIGLEQGTDCTRSVTKMWTVRDAAGNIGTASQTLTFVRDTEKPIITVTPAATIGYNPSDAEIAAAFGSAAVSDNCSSGLVATGLMGTEQGTGCTRSVTKNWVVTDLAGNVASAWQTVTFIRDTEKPVITLTLPVALGYNPTDADIAAAFGTATVSDNYSTGLIATGVMQAEEGSACTRSMTKIWTITDAAGNAASVSQTVTFIRDTEAPSISSVAGPIAPLALGSTATITATLGDNCSGIASVSLDWSDGSMSNMPHPGNAFATSHSYAAPGIYPVRITVTDASGNSAQEVFRFVVVFDPGAGAVTGGGWINSKPGAYPGNPSFTGKGNFGFVCKYSSGSSTPTGQAQFRVSDLSFRSDRYEWLVVNNGKAQFMGEGSVNGAGGYSFLLTVDDGQVSGDGADKFRIKIWNGTRTLYDNVSGAPDAMDTANPQDISQGSIVAHK
jgi:hypothetical protein